MIKVVQFFYDLINLNILLKIGLTPETSTVFEGKPVLTYGQQLTILDGLSYLSLGSTYPIMEQLNCQSIIMKVSN